MQSEKKSQCHHCHHLFSIKSDFIEKKGIEKSRGIKSRNIINNREKPGDSGDTPLVAQINRVGIQEYNQPQASSDGPTTPDPRYRSAEFRRAVRICLESIGLPVTFGQVRALEAQLPVGSRIDWVAWAQSAGKSGPPMADRVEVATPGGKFVTLDWWQTMLSLSGQAEDKKNLNLGESK